LGYIVKNIVLFAMQGNMQMGVNRPALIMYN